MDPKTYDLYPAIGEEEAAAEPSGKLKQVKSGKVLYFVDTNDSTMYHCLEDGMPGDKCGSIVNGKAVMDKKK